MTTAAPPGAGALPGIGAAAALDTPDVLARLGSGADGLDAATAARRLAEDGPNAVRASHARALPVLWCQLRSPLLLLLVVTAAASFTLGERADAVIIGVILTASAGLGFVNEYRAERASDALRSQVRHHCVVRRDGLVTSLDVTDLVAGDVVELRLGEVVPADLRLLEVSGLECDESVLTGESLPVAKSVAAVAGGAALAELTGCALMGTVVHAGAGTGVVVATGARAEFGRIATELGEHRPETEFQIGLRRFSFLLLQVAAVLTGAIFVCNVLLQRPVLDALLFSLAIAVGISPQLLPAVVSTGLAAGSRRLARHKVLVKRLVCIEDLGDIEVLFTDKTGTLTDGRIGFMRSLGANGQADDEPLLLGLLCGDAGNPLDDALRASPRAALSLERTRAYTRIAALPFDHDRRLASVLAEGPGGVRLIMVKGAPESVLSRCAEVPEALRTALDAEFSAGNRVVAVATRTATAGRSGLTPDDETGLTARGLLVFSDPPKAGAREAVERLVGLGVTVKIVTGDNPVVAEKVCAGLGLPHARVVTGSDLDATADGDLADLVAATTVFARVGPAHKARIVRAARRTGVDVAFLGDGVNDAVALHAADVGISVDSATDVAKDAADVLLLEKDLGVLADGVSQGRLIFANTMKYVLMGTSSNFGNMVSAAGASLFLSFLPMLPSQILLNNLLYDAGQLAIPTDEVDPERLARPSRWNVALIRRFMLFFGPISSLFDFATFAVMLWGFHAGPELFRSGWFVESLATQTLVIFAIRTRRVPFVRSRPSMALLLASLGVVTTGLLLPLTPFAGALGFTTPPAGFYAALAAMTCVYLVLIEAGKRWFFRGPAAIPAIRPRRGGHRVHRRAARFHRPQAARPRLDSRDGPRSAARPVPGPRAPRPSPAPSPAPPG